jgi:hypothetical protein
VRVDRCLVPRVRARRPRAGGHEQVGQCGRSLEWDGRDQHRTAGGGRTDQMSRQPVRRWREVTAHGDRGPMARVLDGTGQRLAADHFPRLRSVFLSRPLSSRGGG